jgi:pimeloyl-ACP methyl ester carboxylesterase
MELKDCKSLPTVNINHWNFDYELFGQGSDIIFIHGEIHGTVYWAHQIEEFSKRHRCLVYHRRGHAKTGAPDFGYSLEMQRRDLECLIEHFEIQNPIIVAVAFGTTIAVDYAINHPSNLGGIVLVAWSELHDARQYFERWKSASEQVVHVIESQGRDALADFLRREGGRSIYKVIPIDSPIREDCIQMFCEHPLDEYKKGMLEFATSVPNLIKPFSELELPVLGICGDQDPFPDQPRMLSNMKNFNEAPPVIGAGRFVHWEKPVEFNTVVDQFIRDTSQRLK